MKAEAEKRVQMILIGILVLALIVIICFVVRPQKQPIFPNQAALDEINRLLAPIEERTITPANFDTLKELVDADELAEHEVEELQVLASDKEYSHIGHSIAELYTYLKTGEDRVCPGHELAHYYVFIKHNREHYALEALEEAKEHVESWNGNQTLQTLFQTNIMNIESGNSLATEEEISFLADAECAL